MKKKQFFKRLGLSKSTVSNLTGEHMTKVKAGLYLTDPRVCDTNFRCTEFTYTACPAHLQSDYEYGCCTVAKCYGGKPSVEVCQ